MVGLILPGRVGRGGRRASWQASSRQQTLFCGGAALGETWQLSSSSALRAVFVGCCEGREGERGGGGEGRDITRKGEQQERSGGKEKGERREGREGIEGRKEE